MGFKVSRNTAGVNAINATAMAQPPIEHIIAVTTVVTLAMCQLTTLSMWLGLVSVVSHSGQSVIQSIRQYSISCLLVSAQSSVSPAICNGRE